MGAVFAFSCSSCKVVAVREGVGSRGQVCARRMGHVTQLTAQDAYFGKSKQTQDLGAPTEYEVFLEAAALTAFDTVQDTSTKNVESPRDPSEDIECCPLYSPDDY